MKKTDKIYIAGHTGMVGSALVRTLISKGYNNLILRTRRELDLIDPLAVHYFFKENKPDVVILAAGKVGGILANSQLPAEFLYENLMIQTNIIQQSYNYNVQQFCFLGSACMYPKKCVQPMKESDILTGLVEPTNESFSIAKLTGLKMVQAYHKQYKFPGISLILCNLYGSNDNYDSDNSHVLAALIRKMYIAIKEKQDTVILWGTGAPGREFMHVDDAAEAIIFCINNYYDNEPLNIGIGKEISIKDLALLIAKKMKYKGSIAWEKEKPDGMMHKCLDISRMKKLGFEPKISLEKGLNRTIKEYKNLIELEKKVYML